ncbi:hypothetical protein D3C87_1841340 [compost metagenome]
MPGGADFVTDQRFDAGFLIYFAGSRHFGIFTLVELTFGQVPHFAAVHKEPFATFHHYAARSFDHLVLCLDFFLHFRLLPGCHRDRKHIFRKIFFEHLDHLNGARSGGIQE